jgi:hypothetical protein
MADVADNTGFDNGTVESNAIEPLKGAGALASMPEEMKLEVFREVMDAVAEKLGVGKAPVDVGLQAPALPPAPDVGAIDKLKALVGGGGV